MESLTAGVYEAIGRLAVGFNALEDRIEVYITNLIDLPDWETALWLAQRESGFTRKTDLLRNEWDAHSWNVCRKNFEQLQRQWIQYCRPLLSIKGAMPLRRWTSSALA
jgi:hypothetical protein